MAFENQAKLVKLYCVDKSLAVRIVDKSRAVGFIVFCNA
jgi:hypothetical protein